MATSADGVRVVQWKLRRIAPRALAVLERHRASTMLQHFELTLPPAIARFVELYDARRVLAASRRPSPNAQSAVRELERRVQAWLGPLERDLAGLDGKVFADHSATPDDLVADAERLLEIVRAHTAAGNPALPYAAELKQSLTTAIVDARRHCQQRQARLVQEQAALAEARAAAQAVQRELVAFRRSLRAVLGASHRDYQLLPMHRQLPADAGNGSERSDALDHDGDALTDADAHGAERQPALAPVELIHGGGDQPRAAHAERVRLATPRTARSRARRTLPCLTERRAGAPTFPAVRSIRVSARRPPARRRRCATPPRPPPS